MLVLFVGNDNLLSITGLKDESTGLYLNAETVTADLLGSDGNVISGASSLALAYVAASNGNYQGTLPATVALEAGVGYRLRIAAAGAVTGQWFLPVVAQFRETST